MPVTKKQVDANQRGEETRIDNYQEIIDIVRSEQPVSENKYVIFKLVNTKRNGGTYVPGIDDVKNPKTGKIERIRLLSGIDTIWVKEQKDVDKDYVRQNLRNLQFPRGQKILRISEEDHTMLEFARLCSHNIGSPEHKRGSNFEFFEYDPQKQQKEALSREMFEIEMVMEAQKVEEGIMRKHAHYLGITSVDEYGFPKTVEGIRQEYMLAAKRNPKRFKESLGSKAVEISYLIKKAISEGKIDIGGPDSNINWAKGGFITKLPIRTNAHEYLVELALTNSQAGREFLAQLQLVA